MVLWILYHDKKDAASGFLLLYFCEYQIFRNAACAQAENTPVNFRKMRAAGETRFQGSFCDRHSGKDSGIYMQESLINQIGGKCHAYLLAEQMGKSALG